MDGNLYWNTTVPVGERPILLYLFNAESLADSNAGFCRRVERKCFDDPKLMKAAELFACEKVCFGCGKIASPVPHRKALDKYLKHLERHPTQVKAKIVLLDSKGELIRELDKAMNAPDLLAAMKEALKVNKERLGKS